MRGDPFISVARSITIVAACFSAYMSMHCSSGESCISAWCWERVLKNLLLQCFRAAPCHSLAASQCQLEACAHVWFSARCWRYRACFDFLQGRVPMCLHLVSRGQSAWTCWIRLPIANSRSVSSHLFCAPVRERLVEKTQGRVVYGSCFTFCGQPC